jgi:hypothetical protein
MDANCGRRENGNPCDDDLRTKRSLDYFHQMTEQCVRQKVSRWLSATPTAAPALKKCASDWRG